MRKEPDEVAACGRDDGTARLLVITLPPPMMPGANSRTHWRVRHRASQHDRYVAKTLAMAEMRKSALWKAIGKAALTVTWCGRGRLPDPDNIGGRTKAYIDGFTDAGIWNDDSVVESITFRTKRTKHREVIIEVREA